MGAWWAVVVQVACTGAALATASERLGGLTHVGFGAEEVSFRELATTVARQAPAPKERCNATLEKAVVERVEDRSFDWYNGGDAYRLIGPGGCVYEQFDRDRMGACMTNRWVFTMGGSSSAVLHHNWAKLLLGNELQDVYYPKDKVWADSDLQRAWASQVDIGMRFPEEDVLCFGKTECMAHAGASDASYFSGHHRQLTESIIPELEKYRAAGFNDGVKRPPPDIFIMMGQWQKWCKSGDVVTVCQNLNAKVASSNKSYEEVVGDELEEALAYLRDSWPTVKRIHVDTRHFFSALVPRFTSELSAANGYPEVLFFNSANVVYDGTKEKFISDGHPHSRITFSIATWFLNYLCHDVAPVRFSDPFILFDPDCAPEDDPSKQDTETEAFKPCKHDFVGRGVFSPGNWTTLQRTGAAVFADHWVEGGSAVENPTSGDKTVTNPVSNTLPHGVGVYQGILVLISLIVILYSGVYWFRPELVKRFLQTTRLAPASEKLGALTQPAFDALERILLAMRAAALGAAASATNAARDLCCQKCASPSRRGKDEPPSKTALENTGAAAVGPGEPADSDQSRRISRYEHAEEDVDLGDHDGSVSTHSRNSQEKDGSSSVRDPNQANKDRADAASVSIPVSASQSSGATAGVLPAGASKSGKPVSYLVNPKSKSKKLRALGMARYMASVHIVLGHLYNKDPPRAVRDIYTHGFGYTWVPFFMMLSGFVLTYARLNSRNPNKLEHWAQFTWSRIRGVYPLYLCGVLARAVQIGVLQHGPFTFTLADFSGDKEAWNPWLWFTTLTLTQAWIPQFAEHVLQMHCWFLSCIIPYWMVHQRVYMYLRSLTTSTLWVVAFALVTVPFLGLTIIPRFFGLPLNWNSLHSWQATESAIDILVLMLKFHPLFFFHIYCFGIICAIFMSRVASNPPLMFRYGAVIGYVGLIFVFVISPVLTVPTSSLTLRLGLLAPLQGLLLIGLSLEEDPIAVLFSHPLLAPLENLSYPQYVFQFIAFYGWGTNIFTGVGYFLWLNCLSILGYYFVQSPLKSNRRPFRRQLGGVLSAVVLIPGLVALTSYLGKEALIGAPPPLEVPESALPDSIDIPGIGTDMRLSTAVQGRLLSEEATSHTLINPSIVYDAKRDEMWIALRRHAYFTVVTGGLEDVVWDSKVFLGRLDPVTLKPIGMMVDPFASAQSWEPCRNPTYEFVEGNNTNHRVLTTGPEDPRLLLWDDKLVITTNVNRPVLKTDFLGACNMGRRMFVSTVDLAQDNETTVDQVLAANLDQALLQTPGLELDSTEKNWLAFTTAPENELHFVRSIMPFEVVSFRNNSASSEAKPPTASSQVSSAYYDSTLVALWLNSGVAFHGGANAITYNTTEAGEKVYLGVFHTRSLDGQYDNYFFEFANKQGVWRILRVSAKIPVLAAAANPDAGVTRPMTFMSGLTAVPDGVIVAYGSSNIESRALRMSWSVVAKLLTQGEKK